jgi:signal transduction histidine kinase
MSDTLQRGLASAVIGGSGVAVVAVVANAVLGGDLPTVGVAVAAFGTAIGLALCLGGYGVYRSELTPRGTLRIAGWNALGIAVLGAAVTLVALYQAAVGTPLTRPLFSGTVLVGVSAVAHVLIGYNDVKRIRARELSRERRKLAVLGRLVRHDLRSIAQVLYGHSERARESVGDGELSDRIHDTGERLGEIHEQIGIVQDLVDDDSRRRRVDLGALVEGAVADLRDEHPGATVTVDVPAELAVRGNAHLATAVREVVENAVEHAGAEPRVSVTATVDGDEVALAVADDGPGIPENERAVVLGERDITQLAHGSGLGLWLVKWVLDAAEGSLDIADRSDGTGSVVTMRLPAA